MVYENMLLMYNWFMCCFVSVDRWECPSLCGYSVASCPWLVPFAMRSLVRQSSGRAVITLTSLSRSAPCQPSYNSG